MSTLRQWKERARQLESQTYAVYLACRDPRVPWYAKALAGAVAAYAFSPIDLIPDAIPVLGYLDDLVLVPAGIALALRLIPADVLAHCRSQAQARLGGSRPTNRPAAAVIIAIWLAVAGLSVAWLACLLRG